MRSRRLPQNRNRALLNGSGLWSCDGCYAHRTHLVSELNNLNTQIEDLQVKLNVLQKYRKLKVYAEELKNSKAVQRRSTVRTTLTSLLNMGKSEKEFWSFTRQEQYRKSKTLKSKSLLCGKSCHRQMQNAVRQTRKPVSLPTHSGQSRNISDRSRDEISNRSVNGMTLNDDRLSGERECPSEPSVMIMGKLSHLISKALRIEI